MVSRTDLLSTLRLAGTIRPGPEQPMIRIKTGDIFEEDAEALVNTVNCVGVMGRGVALQFKRRFPENFNAYAAKCKLNEIKLGQVFVFETGLIHGPRYIINFPTKRHWRSKSRLADIQTGLKSLARAIRERRIVSVAIPALGSGLGGLDWHAVRVSMQDALDGLDTVSIAIFAPGSGPTNQQAIRSHDMPSMTAGRAVLVELISRFLRAGLDPFVTLLEVHKLMYFMQATGEPLRLRFNKGPYGPYAENLRHVLTRIDGYLVTGYGDGRDVPNKRLKPVPEAVKAAQAFLQSEPQVQARLRRVLDLVDGFESAFGLELLSTVHWVAEKEDARSLDNIRKSTYRWNPRKRQFTPRQIKLARNVLREKGWLARSSGL